MTDSEPVLFRKVFGSLRPANQAAEELLRSLGDEIVTVKVKRAKGNWRRLAFYWSCVEVACVQLSDAVDGILRKSLLHEYLLKKQGLAKPVRSIGSGELIGWDVESISFAKMSEPDRARFINEAVAMLSDMIGCPVEDLKREGDARTPQEKAA